MDSIAAPIENIQFPTVTICQNEFKPPNEWAYLETVLNNVALKCSNKECKETEKVRKDFDFLIKAFNKQVKSWLFNKETKHLKDSILGPLGEKNSDEVILNLLDDESILHILKKQVAHLVSNKTISMKKLYGLADQFFSYGYDLETVLNLAGINVKLPIKNTIFDQDDDSHPFGIDVCESKSCKGKLFDVVGVWIDALNNVNWEAFHGKYVVVPFGSFVASFSNLIENNLSFQILEELQHLPLAESCKSFLGGDLFLQSYFAQLSNSIGLSVNESTSLFELPSMLATVPYTGEKYNEIKYKNAFFFTSCQINPNTDMRRDKLETFVTWNDYLLNLEGILQCLAQMTFMQIIFSQEM